MKKIGFYVLLMGVLTLQSCNQYRILVIKHPGFNYYVPEKRVGLSWVEFDTRTGVDFSSALDLINEDKKRKKVNKEYIYIKNFNQ